MRKKQILRSSLEILFDTQDLSQVKSFLQAEWTNILTCRFLVLFHCFIFNFICEDDYLFLKSFDLERIKFETFRINLAEFVIAKEYRGRSSYSPKACVAALEIANR